MATKPSKGEGNGGGKAVPAPENSTRAKKLVETEEEAPMVLVYSGGEEDMATAIARVQEHGGWEHDPNTFNPFVGLAELRRLEEENEYKRKAMDVYFSFRDTMKRVALDYGIATGSLLASTIVGALGYTFQNGFPYNAIKPRVDNGPFWTSTGLIRRILGLFADSYIS
mmetsp:Transcript_7928/g.11947  ORF Transcript_7928/g.11947 Transcript_7928/m.11947 type:complete len:168 (-) Transcript_7928:138-641(-)